jgi:hypothetical protein
MLRGLLGVVVLGAFTTDCGGDTERKRRQRDDDAGESGACSGSECAGKGGSANSGGMSGTTAIAGRGGAGAGGSVAGASAGTAGSSGLGGRSGAGGTAGVAGNGGKGGKGGGAAGGGTGGAGGTAGSGGSAGTPTEGGLTITKVALYQATEVTLFEDGDVPEPNAPIVADRAAELRVFVRRQTGYVAHDVVGSLEFTGKRGERTSTITKYVAQDSRADELDTTLNFSLAELDLGEDNTIRIELQEASNAAVILDAWPRSGAAPVEGSSTEGALRLTLVPLVANGVAPDLSTTVVERFRSHLEALYPIPSVEISVREQHVLPDPVLGDDYGTGWDDALAELYELRYEDDAAPNQFYYGVLTPGETFDDYCPVGCVVGLSALAGPNDEEYRGAIGTGYFEFEGDTYSQETLEHELGHALGRDHAPCGTSDAERNFPYPEGDIGVWGWDGLRLRDPGEDADVMSYCSPVWVSDYTFDGLFTRIAYVNGLAARRFSRVNETPKRARTLVLKPDGSVRWGRERTTRTPFDASAEKVELLDAAGRVLGTSSGQLRRFDHLPGGFLSLPAEALAKPGVVAVRSLGVTVAVP